MYQIGKRFGDLHRDEWNDYIFGNALLTIHNIHNNCDHTTMLTQSLVTPYGFPVFLNMCCVFLLYNMYTG